MISSLTFNAHSHKGDTSYNVPHNYKNIDISEPTCDLSRHSSVNGFTDFYVFVVQWHAM